MPFPRLESKFQPTLNITDLILVVKGITQGLGKHVAKLAETDPELKGPNNVQKVGYDQSTLLRICHNLNSLSRDC